MAHKYNSPWKEALDRFLPSFLELLFPEMWTDIDWSNQHRCLSKELPQLQPDSKAGSRTVDALYEVTRKTDSPTWFSSMSRPNPSTT